MTTSRFFTQLAKSLGIMLQLSFIILFRISHIIFDFYAVFKPGAPARTWFLEIAFVREVSMRVCVDVCVCVRVCPPPRP